MSENNTEMQVADGWVKWIEEAISKKHIKYFEYKHFHNIQKIDNGAFGEIYRANWKGSRQYLALKSLINLDDTAAKEIVHELELHREVEFHNNIIRFYGITSTNQENQNGQLKKYLLVMEYADGGSLRNYLKENFKNLTWEDKYKLAFQLADAVSCLHDEEIVHRDLHSDNILIHQKTIKLADFGLSKRIDEASKPQSKIFDVIPYVDPKRLNKIEGKSALQQLKFSDVYSIGVLFWELSSGHHPFKDIEYDLHLAMDIGGGLRETPVPDTPNVYIKLYTECWVGEPNNRPSMNQVVDRLEAIINNSKINEVSPQLPNEQQLNIVISSNTQNSLHGDLSQLIQNFDKVDIKENGKLYPTIQNFSEVNEVESTVVLNTNKNTLFEKDLSIMIDELVTKYIDDEDGVIEQYICDFLDNQNITLHETYNWLLNNQNNSDYIYLLGYFNYFGIGTNVDVQKTIELWQKATNLGNRGAQHDLAMIYTLGIGVDKNFDKAFELSRKLAEDECLLGIMILGSCYQNGIGACVDEQRALELYQKAANLGNNSAQYYLASLYADGVGVDKDYNKAFELYKKSAEGGLSHGITTLGHCYRNGIGTRIDKQKAFEFYQKAANLGNSEAQYSLAYMYEGMDQAIYWYNKSAKQGNQDAQNRLNRLDRLENLLS